jgi:hypothetical protein
LMFILVVVLNNLRDIRYFHNFWLCLSVKIFAKLGQLRYEVQFTIYLIQLLDYMTT